MQFHIDAITWRFGAFRRHRNGGIALVHFHAMAIEFIFLEFNGLPQSLALFFGGGRCITARIHVALDLGMVDAAIHAERLEGP